MTKVTRRQIWLTILATALFAPVVLASAWPALRPSWLVTRVGGAPLGAVLVVALIIIFAAMVVALAARLAKIAGEQP